MTKAKFISIKQRTMARLGELNFKPMLKKSYSIYSLTLSHDSQYIYISHEEKIDICPIRYEKQKMTFKKLKHNLKGNQLLAAHPHQLAIAYLDNKKTINLVQISNFDYISKDKSILLSKGYKRIL